MTIRAVEKNETKALRARSNARKGSRIYYRLEHRRRSGEPMVEENDAKDDNDGAIPGTRERRFGFHGG